MICLRKPIEDAASPSPETRTKSAVESSDSGPWWSSFSLARHFGLRCGASHKPLPATAKWG